jgi:hypothetical protein
MFRNKGLIDANILTKRRQLRGKVLELSETDLWNVKSVIDSKEWLEIIKNPIN